MDKVLVISNILATIGFILIIIAIILTKSAINKYERKIVNQEAMIANRDKLIKDLQARNAMSTESNAILRNEVEELNLLLTKVANLSYEGQFSTELTLSKIKKLVCDYQSKN